MKSGGQTALPLAEIKSAIADFESGKENAQITLTRILDACKAAVEPEVIKRDAV